MFDEFFSLAAELQREGKPFATAEVVRSEKPTSGRPGDKAIKAAPSTDTSNNVADAWQTIL